MSYGRIYQCGRVTFGLNNVKRVCLGTFRVRPSLRKTWKILCEHYRSVFAGRIIERGGDFYIVLLDCERPARSWESNAEKVTSDVRSRNSSHGFYFQRFQTLVRGKGRKSTCWACQESVNELDNTYSSIRREQWLNLINGKMGRNLTSNTYLN